MPEVPASEMAAVPAPLPVLQKNAAANPRKMRRVITEDYSWSLEIVPLLTELCLQHIVRNFEHKPMLDQLLPKHKAKVLDALSTSLPLEVTANLISYEDYWRRRCVERWPVCDISRYGSSWKRLFFERHLENLIERLIPDVMETRAICEAAELSKDYVKKLDIQQLLPPVKVEIKKDEGVEEVSDEASDAEGDLPSMDHFDFNLIANSLCGLEELHLVYGVKGCGMNFEWNLFRFTERDCNLLAATFKKFINLKVFRLHKSKVDDKKARVLIRSLLDHPSLVHLDLSHNQISDRGARAIGKLLNQSKLQILNLCDNNVRPHGAKAIAHALFKNSTLNTLNLRLNHIGDEGGLVLCKALLHNNTVAALHLGSNELSEPTASVLSQVLTQNTSLKSISLSSNSIGQEGGKKLLKGMSENNTLLEFDLRLTDAGQENEFFINQVLKSNQDQARLQCQPEPAPSPER